MAVIDFAWARPSIAQLKAAGITAVVRYVGPASWGKTITTEEFELYLSAGISVALVFEQGDSDGDGGFSAGVANAKVVLANLPKGWPADRPIYMAVDKGVSGPALDTSVAYIAGASSVLGPARTGDYGEGALCKRTEAAGTAKWHWQSESTSFLDNAEPLPISHLIQKFDASPIADSDLNIVLQADFGQHPAPVAPPTPSTPEEETMITGYLDGPGGQRHVFTTSPDGQTVRHWWQETTGEKAGEWHKETLPAA